MIDKIIKDQRQKDFYKIISGTLEKRLFLSGWEIQEVDLEKFDSIHGSTYELLIESFENVNL